MSNTRSSATCPASSEPKINIPPGMLRQKGVASLRIASIASSEISPGA